MTESLLQLPFRGNCLNWVVGHLVTAREDSLTLLGLPGVLSKSEQSIYGYGSEPLVDASRASDLDDLLKKLDESFNLLTGSLEKLSQSEADRQVEIWKGPMPLWRALSFMFWHESYHTGQLEQLRQLAGKNDHVF